MKRCCGSAFVPLFIGAVLLAVGVARAGDGAGIAPPGAADSNLQTILTDLQQASQQTPAQTLQVVTTSAVEPTLCPAVATQCPVVETLCPPVTTRCPKAETHCPAAETTCPPALTRCPA